MSKKLLKPLPNARQDGHILALDMGTTGVKAIVFDSTFFVVARAYRPLKKSLPHFGWVEQDPKELLAVAKEVLREAVVQSALPPNAFASMGIANQRETTIMWDNVTGIPVYPAIVWEDTRTAALCRALQKKSGKAVQTKTGLPINPYFSASKIHWILTHVSKARKLLSEHRLLFGTVDSWIVWNLLEGRPHVTDCTNASRTLLFNIRTLRWDKELFNVFGIPQEIVPTVLPSRADFGMLASDVVGFRLPVRAICGDQQASLLATGLTKGTTKVTYGTGTFVMHVLGSQFKLRSPFLTTLAACAHKPVYVLEAKINNTGTQIQSVLDKPEALHASIRTLTKKVATLLKALPIKPKEVVIDGGITRSRDLPSLQSRAASVIVRKQKIYDGTALGVAKLAAQA